MAWNLKIDKNPQVRCDMNGVAVSAGVGLPREMAKVGDKASWMAESLEMREL